MKKYSGAREKAIEDFDRTYFGELLHTTSGDLSRASKLSGLEIEHLRERSRDLGIEWPKREARELTPKELADIDKRLDKGETPSSIAIRHGIGKSRVLYRRRIVLRRRRARKR